MLIFPSVVWFIKRVISNFLGDMNKKTAIWLGTRALPCPLAHVTDALPESWGGTLGFILSPVKCCYLALSHMQCRLGSPIPGKLWGNSACGWDLPWTTGLQPTLFLKRLGQSQAYLPWNSPAVWQSGGLTLDSAAAIMVQNTCSGLCAEQGPEHLTSYARKVVLSLES